MKTTNIQSSVTAEKKLVRRSSILTRTLIGVGFSFVLIGNANAHCTWFHPGHCVEDAVNTVVDTANDIADTATTVANDIADTTTNTANDVATFSETAVTTTANTVENGVNQATKAIEGAAMSVYKKGAELVYQQMGTPLNNMAGAWKNFIASEPVKYQRLVNAIRNNNGPETQAALEEVLVSLYTYAGFAAIVEDFKDKNAGSLLFIVSAGGGVGVTLEGDIGLAIDIDYLINLANRVANGHSSSTFSGAIGSLFTAAGIQIGPAAGGGVDFVVGYHTANPDGVYGPGLDISLEIKAAAGGGFGFSYDLSQAPWQIVTGGVGVGAGVELKAAIGPSYALVIGQLCSDGSLKEFANQCPTSTTNNTSSSNTGTQITLLSAHGKYVVAESDGNMNANRNVVGPWERFTLIVNTDGTVSFLSAHGKYAVAESNGAMNANRNQIGPWEKFTRINNSDGTVSFRSVHGKYVVAESNGKMNANRNRIGSWEKFYLN